MLTALGVTVMLSSGCDRKREKEWSPLPLPRSSSSVPASSSELRPLSARQKATLLVLARRSLDAAVKSTWPPHALTGGLTIGPRLRHKQGAFVTLKKRGRLRGCIGTILPRMPLYQAVISNARNAALKDPRFPEVTPGELGEIVVEVSALSVPKKIGGYGSIVVGRHGIILRQGNRSATFLPHVATEQGWNRAQTLRHLSRKAGLPTSAWKDPATVYHVYTAEVWSEEGEAHPLSKSGATSSP